MDRAIIYPGQIPASADILFLQRAAMISDGYLAQAVVGSGPVVDGLTATPAVGSLGVVMGPGSIFQSTIVDQNSFSSLAADADPVTKIGVNTTSTTFPLTAPTTAGQSISYLLEAAFLESDGASAVIPYFNSANTAQPFSGPGGAGGAQLTRRFQSCQIQLRAGVAAPTGTQAVPAVDAGWCGLYVVTVNYGESSVQPGDIAVYPNAPFVGQKLPALNAALSALTAELNALAVKEAADYKAAVAATAAVRPGTSQFLVTDAVAGVKSFTAPWTGTYRVTTTGGGGGGGGSTGTQAGGGGGAGGTAIGYVQLTAGQVVGYVVGGAGLMGSDAGATGGYGSSSSFGSYLAASGGGPGQGGQSGSAGGQGGAGTCAASLQALLLYGGCGSDGSPGGNSYGGVGGASFFGGGARGGTADGILEDGQSLGCGGGGAYYQQHGGGYGGPGCVVVEG